MKILVGVRGDHADSYFRARAPFAAIRYTSPHEVVIKRPSSSDVEWLHVAFFQRLVGPNGELIGRMVKEQGKPLIYDVDDDLFGIPPSWGTVYDEYFDRGSGEPGRAPLYHHRQMLKMADVVTCPSEHLGEMLKRHRPGMDVRILPNYILQGDWDTIPVMRPAKEIEFDKPIVGWFGHPYYWDSWKEAAPFISEGIIKADAILVILGFPEVVHCFPEELCQRTYCYPLRPFKKMDEVRSLIAGFDVGIIPLEDISFNRCKSTLKALQFGAAGVPLICSDVVYGDVVEHGKTALICEKPEHFAQAIPAALADREAARLMASQWQRVVFEEHTYEGNFGRWLELLEELRGEAAPGQDND